MHPSELARAEREAHYDREAATSVIRPGSVEEEMTLLNIDLARAEHEAALQDDFAARRRQYARRLRDEGLRPDEIGRG